MHPRTLGRWLAAYQIDPWDENRADWRSAEVASAVVNVAGAKKADGSLFTPDDFVPFVKAQADPEAVRRLEIEREEAQLMEFFENHNARHKANLNA